MNAKAKALKKMASKHEMGKEHPMLKKMAKDC